MKIFGFEIKRPEDNENLKSFVEPDDADGSLSIAAAGPGAFFGTSYVDMEGAAKNEAELISKYRQMEQHPEVAKAIEDVVNEAIVVSDDQRVVDVNLDDTELSDKIKKIVSEEFQNILDLLDFSNKGYDTFNRWYVDGRIRYHVIVDEKNIKEGIQELRYIDPRKLRKVKEIAKSKSEDVDVVLKKVKNEYWIFNDKGFVSNSNTKAIADFSSIKGVKIAKDSIVECNSGILNENNTLILSHLHKAIKPHNQLRMLEDAAVIYRLSRAPERRVFYIDVGNLPKMKAEQYLRDMMVKHKNRLVYDATSGEIRDDRRHMTMMEDFWLPRREGGRGTEITTLPGGQNLGEMDDVMYFQKNLYKALNVPISRLEPESGFSLGRASEISRDEIKFSKFIRRLRNRFSILFDEILEKQLILKNVMTIEEWKQIKNKIRYDFQEDNHFEELKHAEILRERIQTMRDLEEYVGKYYSQEWVRKNILMQSDDDIEKMDEQIAAEDAESDEDDQDINNNDIDDSEGV
jgi:hypothetical protein